MIISGYNAGGLSEGIVNTISLTGETYPMNLALNPAGTRLYVLCTGTKKVVVIDTATDSIVTKINIGTGVATTNNYWTGISVNRSGAKVFVQGAWGQYYGDLLVIDTSTNVATTAAQSLPAGGVACNPTKDTMWVTYNYGYNAGGGSYVKSTANYVDVGTNPPSLSNIGFPRYNSTGTKFISTAANQIVFGVVNGDGSHGTQVADYRIATNDWYPDACMSADGQKCWAPLANKLHEFTVGTNNLQPLRNFSFDTDINFSTSSICVNAAETKAIITRWSAAWNVKVIDITNMSVLKTYAYTTGVNRACLSADGTTAYLANSEDGTVSVLKI
jgi:YVTN family beta-propeller protein